MIFIRLKELFFVKYPLKILAFVLAVGFLPLIILFVGLGEEPDWIDQKEHHLEQNYAVTVTRELKFFHEDEEINKLQEQAASQIKAFVKRRAEEQIMMAYGIAKTDKKQMASVEQFLDQTLEQFPRDLIVQQDTYRSELAMKRYGLYSISRTDLDVWLQEVYRRYNQKILQDMGF